jgi:hypothetical protein
MHSITENAMRRLTRITASVSCALVVCVLAGGAAQAPKKKEAKVVIDPKVVVMQKKLVQAQKLLEGLALADFAKIGSAADELAELRKQSAWMVLKTRDYELFSIEFSRQIDAAKRAAKNKNTDAAALAYVDMTLTCVKCHKHVRDEGIALGHGLANDSLGR